MFHQLHSFCLRGGEGEKCFCPESLGSSARLLSLINLPLSELWTLLENSLLNNPPHTHTHNSQTYLNFSLQRVVRVKLNLNQEMQGPP